ncbi:hypothetical protein B0T24DRAFT_679252 [Lasiosphaeria ovina]|uniref:Zn(2)-C6 fungal-type domain-containing protein n=1 Tax=Lasiosphaeria ovina TaxID=92902 RepID=A0AAE0N8D6_9PEZI|nr:hypothetical protein B0T24DRAFT_679252 [Lasiosphaeria ovina]
MSSSSSLSLSLSPGRRPSAAAPLSPASTVSGTPTDASKPKRARTSKPKVKTGCNNCKQRRIKCDEKRPSCANCLRSKKSCTGYPPPSRSARPFEEIRIAPKPLAAASAPPPGREPIQLPPRRVAKYQRRTTPPLTPSTPSSAVAILHTPSTTLPFDETEGLYYRLFREHTANELSGFFDSAFWERTVLQECHSQAAIRHAVVALGALYKTLEQSTESPPGSPAGDGNFVNRALRHWEMAVRQYSNACNSLVLAKSAESTSHRTRLMASVLLACFDSFIGDHKQAIVQVQNGLALLEILRAERRRAFIPKPEEPVEEELIQIFTRLAIQAKSYDMAFHFPHPYVVCLTTPAQAQDPSSPSSEGASPVSLHHDPIPGRFTSVLEARLAWDTLAERILRFTETMFMHTQNQIMGVLPESLRQYGMQFKKDIDSWSDAFESILASRTAPGVNSQEKAGVAVLKMTQVMGQILFLMTFSDTEMQFDSFTSQFKAIVDLAIEVVGDEERRAAAKRCPDPRYCRHRRRQDTDIFGGHEYAACHIKPSFSADLGIVPPLFVVATKCRNGLIRRQAIQLLRSSSRREGMWDSELTARIGTWIAEVEETEDAPSPVDNFVKQSPSRPSTSGSSTRLGSTIDFGDMALGPGGNAKWESRRRGSPASDSANASSIFSRPPRVAVPEEKRIPEEKRVMVRAVEFDLRERYAFVQLGSRELPTGTHDTKTRVTKIWW